MPEVLGADTQECPHCGAEVASSTSAVPEPRTMVDAAAGAAAALRVARTSYLAALLLWIPALVVDVAASLGISYYQSSHGIPPDVAAIDDAQRLELLGVGVPLLALTFLLKLALFAPTAGLVLDRMGVTREGSALASAARRVLAILALGAILLLLYVVGTLLALVGLIVLYHWFQFAPAAFADRRGGVTDALGASRRFAQERRAYGFTALSFFALFAAIVLDLVLNAGGNMLMRALLPQDWSDAIVGSVALWLVTPFLAILPAAYWGLATRAPAPPAAPDAEAPAPAPRALATTKCPQCATLIPYTPTGAPVDVTCPVCGRKGKVL